MRGKIGLTKTKREKKHRAVSHDECCSQQDAGQVARPPLGEKGGP